MNDRLYKQQIERMRPIAHPEFTWWEESKLFGGLLLGLALLCGGPRGP